MESHRQIAVIAPEQLAGAFSVLIQAAPDLNLLASATDLDELCTILGEKKPDVFLVYPIMIPLQKRPDQIGPVSTLLKSEDS